MARHSLIILPNSALQLNRLMAATEVARSDGINEIISTMWDPYNCPRPFLPYLAWALSVDVWSNDWPEEKQRDAIAASPLIHRRKGTLDAVERALAALGVRVRILEWFLQEPIARRGTFEVVTVQEDEGLQVRELMREAEAAVLRSKPKSRVATFTHKLHRQAGIHLGAFAHAGGRIVHRNEITEDQAIEMSNGLKAVAYARGRIIHRNEP